MSKLILCTGNLSKTPYYIVGLGVNIYSIEELCFYLMNNAYILDQDMIDEKLCDYIDRELGLKELAFGLKELIKDGTGIGEFVTRILNEVHYCSDEEIKRIEKLLVDNASLDFVHKHKARADNLLKAKKYTLAIDEYQYILRDLDRESETELYASILHNIAVAHAQLFLYEKSAYYFHESLEVKENEETLYQYLICLRLTMSTEQFERYMLRMGYDDSVGAEVDRRLANVKAATPDSDYFRTLDEIRNLKKEGRVSEYYRLIDETLSSWKQEYRKRMIVRSSK